jgi:predicted PurR-regulated permease PerM
MSMTPNIVRRTTARARTIASKPIVIILIIAAIVLVVFLLYTQIQVGNESYKIENYEALWNQSLANFRSGNTTIDEYCINRVHDEDFCNRFMSLQYFN